MGRVLDKLMVGLVPLRGRCIDYVVVRCTNDRDLLVHRGIYQQLSESVSSRRLFLVGVAEQALFWKDIRRVVFSQSTYTVLARVGRSSLQGSWTPLKLVDVLSRLSPTMADAIEGVNESVLAALAQGAISDPETGVSLQRSALWRYATLLADHAAIEISESELDEGGLLDGATGLSNDASVGQWRTAFDPLTTYVETKSGAPIDRTFASRCRTTARLEAGFGQLLNTPQPATNSASTHPSPADESLLDTEIIAIYW